MMNLVQYTILMYKTKKKKINVPTKEKYRFFVITFIYLTVIQIQTHNYIIKRK